ncbi:hypothetical protein TWF730_005705 [Orbilia blumenaviensis]|uniref:Uncharacterized protein n=1 Tax=Orbilia blumenaviensis TaxID=1796055 RepID=A0AAV9VLE4_9PEZI
MEHFAPFTANAVSQRYETAELTSSIVLVENAVRQRNDDTEAYELDAQGSHHESGLDNLQEMPVPSYGGPAYTYAELPARTTPTTSSMNGASSPRPASVNYRQAVAASRSTTAASPSLHTPFDAFDNPEYYWNPDQTASAIPTTQAAPAPLPPPPSQSYPRKKRFKPIESSQFLPEYVADNFIQANPDQDGFFCVFRTTYVLRSDGKTIHEGHLPANQTTLWKADRVSGHLFEVTWWGSMIYHGPFQDNEREFTTYWGRKSTIKAVVEPTNDTHSFLFLPGTFRVLHSNFIKLDCLAAASLQAARKPKASTFNNNPQFEQFQGGDIRSLTQERAPMGSWRRIFNQFGYALNPTIQPSSRFTTEMGSVLLYCSIPRLFAHIISTGKNTRER